MKEEEGVFRTADRTGLHWYAWRRGTPRAHVLVVHGLGDHAGRYRELARALVDHGFASLAYDQRGHGRSPGPRGHAPRFEVLVADLRAARALVDTVLGAGPPVVLLGHSMGGLLALDFLGTPGHRVDMAVLSAPWLATRVSVPGWKRMMGRVLDRLWPRLGLGTGHDASALTRDAEMVRAYDEDPHVHARLSPRLFFEVERAQTRVLGGASRPRIDMLFLIPEADPIVRGEVTAEYAAEFENGSAAVLRLPGSRHEPFNELGRRDVYLSVARWIEERV